MKTGIQWVHLWEQARYQKLTPAFVESIQMNALESAAERIVEEYLGHAEFTDVALVLAEVIRKMKPDGSEVP